MKSDVRETDRDGAGTAGVPRLRARGAQTAASAPERERPAR